MGQQTAQPPANPYAAPKAEVEDVGAGTQWELAGRRQRLGAAFLDGILFGLCGMLASSGLGMLAVMLGALGIVGLAGTNLWLLNRNGQSVGKYSFDIKVVRTDGETAGLGRLIFLRGVPQWVISGIPLLNLLSLVDALFIFRADRRCVHDLIADTMVVKSGS